MVLFWFFDTIDLEKCVIAINTFYFRSFACVKNTIKRTAPRRFRNLARSVRRVIACQSRGSANPRLSGGFVEKKNSVCYWPESSRSDLPTEVLRLFFRFVSAPAACRQAGVLLSSGLRVSSVAVLRARQAPLPHASVARLTICASCVWCSQASNHKQASRFMYYFGSSARYRFLMSRKTELSMR